MTGLQRGRRNWAFPVLIDMIADETVATTEDEVIAYCTEKGHPALTMESIL